MTCYIIACELSEGADYGPLYEAIKAYSGWARITKLTWAVVTAKSAVEIRDHLSKITGTERLFVVKSGVEAAWSNSRCSDTWLKENL